MSEQLQQFPPNDWKRATVGQVSDCILGGTPSTEVPQFWGGSIPWMASGDVHIRRIYDVPGRITELGLRSSNATLTSPPTVAVGLAGQGKTRGTVALVLCTLSTNQSIALLRANGIDLRTDYLFHNLDSRYEELRARSSGGGRGGLSKAILEMVPIDLPPLIEQRKISEILDTLDTAIHETEAIIAKLKAVKQGLLHDLLTRGIDANGELRLSQDEAPHLYKESPLGWIPKKWESITTTERCSLITKGTTPATNRMWQDDEGIRFLRVDNLLFDGTFDFEASNFRISLETHKNELRRSICLPDDVLMNIVGPPLGKLGIVTDVDGEMNINQAIALFRPKPELLSKFLLVWLGSVQAQNWFRKRAKQTSGQVNLTLGLCQELPLPDIPIEEQKAIVSRVEEIQNRISWETEQLGKLLMLKSGLMDDLLTGRVRVTPLLEASSSSAQRPAAQIIQEPAEQMGD